VVLGVVGAASVGLAGLLAQGFHILEAGVLFLGGNLLAVDDLGGHSRLAQPRCERVAMGRDEHASRAPYLARYIMV
jgi:hypothetical protein